jgi:putative flippase GtrA
MILKKEIIKIYSFFFKHPKHGEVFRYLLVGGTCTVIDMLLLVLLVEFGHLWYLTASIISYSSASLLGYFGQKYFTFENKSKQHLVQLPLFYLVSGMGLLLNSACLFLFAGLLKMWYVLAYCITKIIVLIWNYLANKFITFKNHHLKISKKYY